MQEDNRNWLFQHNFYFQELKYSSRFIISSVFKERWSFMKGKGDVRAERAWRRRESWGRVYNVGVLRKRRVGCWEMGAIEVGPSQVVEFMSLF